jgi:hypothetical protein
MSYPQVIVKASNSAISGNTLTLGTVTEGNVGNITVGMTVKGPGVVANTTVTVVSSNNTTLTISPSQTIANVLIEVQGYVQPGDSTTYLDCYNGTPTNSEGTPDSRSSVQIDGVDQVPPNPVSKGQWTWIVPTGSTISYAFNVALGNSAT